MPRIAKSIIPLPETMIQFILSNPDKFNIMLEDGKTIIITPKIAAGSEAPARAAHDGDGAAPAVEKKSILRPRYVYKPLNKRYTPAQAKAFGLSKPRLQIYEVVYAAGEKGTHYAELREKTKLPHGSVMQILNWLRKQKLISGAPEAVK